MCIHLIPSPHDPLCVLWMQLLSHPVAKPETAFSMVTANTNPHF